MRPRPSQSAPVSYLNTNITPVYPVSMCSKTHFRITDPQPKCPASGCFSEEFGIPQLPQIMRQVLKWPMSAAIMEKWFSLPRREFTKEEKQGDTKPRDIPPQYVDTKLITWDWLNRFERVQQARSQLLAILGTSKALDVLANRVKKNAAIMARLSTQKSIEIANNPQSPIDLHSDWQFQFVEVGYQVNQIDDLYGALGNFMLAAAVTKASLTLLRPGVAHISVKEVGLYVRDTFEFNGRQYLGHWSEHGLGLQPLATASNLINSKFQESNWILPGWHPQLGWLKAVNNSDFRTYRERSGYGGDFLLLSDVKLAPVQLSVEIKL